MLFAMAFGTGLVQVPAGTALLTAYPVALGFLLGSSRLSLQLAGSYVALRVLHHLCLLGAHLPLVPWLIAVDVFLLDENETSFFIKYMHVGSGAIVQVYTIEYQKKLDDEQKEYILGLGIVEMRERFRSHANEIIVPFIPEGVFPEGISFTVPQRGDKRKLLELSLQNAKQYKVDKLKRSEKFNPEQRATRLLTTIQKDLHLPV